MSQLPSEGPSPRRKCTRREQKDPRRVSLPCLGQQRETSRSEERRRPVPSPVTETLTQSPNFSSGLIAKGKHGLKLRPTATTTAAAAAAPFLEESKTEPHSLRFYSFGCFIMGEMRIRDVCWGSRSKWNGGTRSTTTTTTVDDRS